MAGPGMKLRPFSLSWFFALALAFRQTAPAGRCSEGLLIPEAEGDSTPLGQRSLCVLPVVYRIWASVRLAHIQEWFYAWVPDSCQVLAKVFPQ